MTSSTNGSDISCDVTSSAPTVLQAFHLDGITVTSSQDIRTLSAYARTDILYVGSRDGTCTMFPILTIRVFLTGISVENHFHRMFGWLDDQHGPRWIRGLAVSEPASSHPQRLISFGPHECSRIQTTCDCCAAARIVRELDSDMAKDVGKIARTDEMFDVFSSR